jgi:hypothetical protein
MADIHCDFCADNLAEFIVGNVNTGDQQFCCRFDFARLGLGIAKAVLPPAELDAALAGPASAEPAAVAGEDGLPVEPKRRRGRAPKRNGAAEATEGLETATTAAKDG